jgi:hypothetical protein
MDLKQTRGRVKTGLANASFFAALIGGICAALSTLGAPMRGIAQVGPWWAPWIWFVVACVICLGDWAEGDATPNRRAVYTAIAFPSFLVAALTGDSGQKMRAAGDTVTKTFGEHWGTACYSWINNLLKIDGDMRTALTVFSILLIGMAVVWAHQFARKNKAGGRGGGGERFAGTGR